MKEKTMASEFWAYKEASGYISFPEMSKIILPRSRESQPETAALAAPVMAPRRGNCAPATECPAFQLLFFFIA